MDAKTPKVKLGSDYIAPQSRREQRDALHFRHYQPAPTVDMERLQRALLGPYHGTHYGDRAVAIACALGGAVVLLLGLLGWL